MLNWSSAVTVKVNAVPAVALAGALTGEVAWPLPALTRMVLLVPVIELVAGVGGGERLVAGGLQGGAEGAGAVGQRCCWPAGHGRCRRCW